MAGFDETFDWVVVGSGAGSMISALVMRQADKSVVILEKTAWAGGTTAKSGGVMWIPANRFMLADGEQDSADAAMTYLDALQELDGNPAPGTSREKRLAYVTQAPLAIDFLVDKGVALQRGATFWPDYYDELPGGCKTSRTVVAKPFDRKELGSRRDMLRKGFAEFNVTLVEGMEAQGHRRTNKASGKMLGRIVLRTLRDLVLGRKYTTAGGALQGRLLKAGLAAGVDLRLNAPVSELVIEDGTATGVVTMRDGKPWRIGARLGVLVNAGGFAQNQAMRDTYMPGTQAQWSQTAEGDTGEMHRELERIGGQLAQMDQLVGYQMTLAPGWDKTYVAPGAQSMTGKPHAILVDQTGQRYMNEGGSYELYCENMRKRNIVAPSVPSWAILDRHYVELYAIAGKFIDKKIPENWIESGYLHTADTIEGLAGRIDVDPAALAATVARWNGHVAKGMDEDFHRGERAYDNCGFVGDPFSERSAIGAIDKAPFYAVPVVPGDVSTYGGVITDAKGRVVTADGNVIAGLYATGVTTASVMGNVYPGAGASIGPSLTFGYIAARHAAGLDNQL
ncbi:fumarate reductase/succinate dehydrogenase flavoprotein domain protein [Sphingobium indicum BiD32]|uniref:Fumarate reductase/succinate dehydrogenase flavoprotein domain protein n=1 Tax=Sphingobium indicum BiD32 TaxID=1301087 RepID=N1ML94_9SPHN|nr:FAD-binding protein [Sphingobium indicum]CCW16392.1 fumarate reductase/succinate dehydrogenase flavoprotein domain protein [Sphingobium indicum BiD32]